MIESDGERVDMYLDVLHAPKVIKFRYLRNKLQLTPHIRAWVS